MLARASGGQLLRRPRLGRVPTQRRRSVERSLFVVRFSASPASSRRDRGLSLCRPPPALEAASWAHTQDRLNLFSQREILVGLPLRSQTALFLPKASWHCWMDLPLGSKSLTARSPASRLLPHLVGVHRPDPRICSNYSPARRRGRLQPAPRGRSDASPRSALKLELARLLAKAARVDL